MQHDKAGGVLVVIGGGRWARVTLSVLAGLDVPFAKIILISRHGGGALADAIAQANHRQQGKFAQAQDLETVLETERVGAAIVVNTARDHARTALPLLARKIPLLVEKPVALTADEAAQLVDAAKASQTLLMPGHVFSFCGYLQNFSDAARRALGTPRSITIRWRDAPGEMRYGEAKSYDTGLGIAEEVGPHIITILSMLIGGTEGRIETTAISRGGLAVEVKGQWHESAFTLSLERDAASRERLIVLNDRSGGEARLDFAAEPGTMFVAGRSGSADPQWPRPYGPLALQIQTFLQNIGMPPHGPYLQSILDSTKFIAQIAQQVRAAQERLIAEPDSDPTEQRVALRELLAPLLMPSGCWRPGDSQALELRAQEAVHMMAGKLPRPTLTELVRNLQSGT